MIKDQIYSICLYLKYLRVMLEKVSTFENPQQFRLMFELRLDYESKCQPFVSSTNLLILFSLLTADR